MVTSTPDELSLPSARRDSAWISLVALAAGIFAVAASTVSEKTPLLLSWEAPVAIALVFVGLWVARASTAARRGVHDRRVGYGITALVAVLSTPTWLPMAGYHWGYLTVVGATFTVLGWRSRQQITWIYGLITALIGAFTGAAVIRTNLLGIHESPATSTVSAIIQAGLATAILATAFITGHRQSQITEKTRRAA